MIYLLLQRAVERAPLWLVLETYFRLVGERGPTPLVEGEYEDVFLRAYEGDFALMVEVNQSEAHEEALARFVARALRTKVVISDDSNNPFTWVLIDERGLAQPLWQEPVDQECFFAVHEQYRHLLAPCLPAQQPESM
jgi:hypothetical protein